MCVYPGCKQMIVSSAQYVRKKTCLVKVAHNVQVKQVHQARFINHVFTLDKAPLPCSQGIYTNKLPRSPYVVIVIVPVLGTINHFRSRYPWDLRDSLISTPRYPWDLYWQDSVVSAHQVPWALAGPSLFSPPCTLGTGRARSFEPPQVPGGLT